jgi:hypothetical protein
VLKSYGFAALVAVEARQLRFFPNVPTLWAAFRHAGNNRRAIPAGYQSHKIVFASVKVITPNENAVQRQRSCPLQRPRLGARCSLIIAAASLLGTHAKHLSEVLLALPKSILLALRIAHIVEATNLKLKHRLSFLVDWSLYAHNLRLA